MDLWPSVTQAKRNTMCIFSDEIELIGGPYDGYRAEFPWIPISGLQIKTAIGMDEVACYEWGDNKLEMVDGVPQVCHRLNFSGCRRPEQGIRSALH
jgi:hypothetical protein